MFTGSHVIPESGSDLTLMLTGQLFTWGVGCQEWGGQL